MIDGGHHNSRGPVMTMRTYQVKADVIRGFLDAAGCSQKQFRKLLGCSERYLRMVLNEGRPVSEDIVLKMWKATGIPPERLLVNPAEWEHRGGAGDFAIIKQFFDTMFAEAPGEAVKLFAEGAKLCIRGRLLATGENGSRDPDEIHGLEQIGWALDRICSLARVRSAEVTSHSLISGDRVLVEGRVVQEFQSNPEKPILYVFMLVFTIRDGKIHELDMQFDTRKVAEALQ
jgi:hypothetical protein